MQKPSATPGLAALVEQALAAPWNRLRFVPTLEACFNADTAAARTRHLTAAAVIGCLFVMMFMVSDHALIPDVFVQSVALRGVVSPLLTIAGVAYLRRTKSASIREGVFTSFGILIQLVIVYLAVVTHSPHKATTLSGAFLVTLYVNVVGQVRFTYAVAGTIYCLAVTIGCLMFISGIAAPVKLVLAGVNLTTGVLTLFTNFQLERQDRRHYLMTMREHLRNEALADNNLALRTLSEEDALTGVYNRRGIDERIDDLFRAAKRDRCPIGVAMIDVDRFKDYNDHFGHPAGDACLQTIAAILIDQTRGRHDLVGRYGGEEFIVVMPDTDLAGVRDMAERLRIGIEAHGLPAPPSSCAAGMRVVTASFGIAACTHAIGRDTNECPCRPDDMIRLADRSLYAAKQSGRNCVNSG